MVPPLDDCRECVGGVGGRSGCPILLDECFNVRRLLSGEVRLAVSVFDACEPESGVVG
jgi:hypothetical protein